MLRSLAASSPRCWVAPWTVTPRTPQEWTPLSVAGIGGVDLTQLYNQLLVASRLDLSVAGVGGVDLTQLYNQLLVASRLGLSVLVPEPCAKVVGRDEYSSPTLYARIE